MHISRIVCLAIAAAVIALGTTLAPAATSAEEAPTGPQKDFVWD